MTYLNEAISRRWILLSRENRRQVRPVSVAPQEGRAAAPLNR